MAVAGAVIAHADRVLSRSLEPVLLPVARCGRVPPLAKGSSGASSATVRLCEPHFRGAFHRRTDGRNPVRSKLLRQRTRRWHLHEMVVPIARKRMYLSRAVDHEGEILDVSAHYDSLIAVPATISKVPTKTHLPAV